MSSISKKLSIRLPDIDAKTDVVIIAHWV